MLLRFSSAREVPGPHAFAVPGGADAVGQIGAAGPGAAYLPRPRLEALVGEVLTHRLTVVAAGAGFGKSTLLASWAAQGNCAWYSLGPEDQAAQALARGIVDALRLRAPGVAVDFSAALVTGRGKPAAHDDEVEMRRAQVLAQWLAEALEQGLARELFLVLDDVDEVGLSGSAGELMASLCRQAPANFHLVLGSRMDPPFAIERLRGRGQVLELGGRDLAFSEAEVAAMVERQQLGGSPAVTARLHRLTDGWPAAVRLAVEALGNVGADQHEEMLDRLALPEGTLFGYLSSEVLGALPDEARRLISIVATAGFAAPELCERLQVAGAAEVLRSLARRGLFIEGRGQRLGWFSLSVLVREAAKRAFPLPDEEARAVVRVTAEWLEEQGHYGEALRYCREHSHWASAAPLLAKWGPELVKAGEVGQVLATYEALPDKLRGAGVHMVAGDAYCVAGDWDNALDCYRRAAEGRGPLPVSLAWRIARTHHFRGDLNQALETYGDADVVGGDERDGAMLLAWRAAARWLRGDAEGCRSDAVRSCELAARAGDAQALSCAYTALAMLAALEGDRVANDAHYLRALDYAEQAGDVLQQVRVRTNRGSLHLEQGYYHEAIAELDVAVRLAEMAGFASYRSLALSNRANAYYFVGRFEEAVADLEESRRLSERLGSADVAYPLALLGRIYGERGDLALARAAYEEAISRSEVQQDLQGLVPALSGLAIVLAHDDPLVARELAARAVAFGPGMAYVDALLAAGWVALAGGHRGEAVQWAVPAAAEARSRRDRAGLAQSLELSALCGPEPAAANQLEQAVALWDELGSVTGSARAELLLGLVSGDIAKAEAAAATLRSRGVRSEAALRGLVGEAAAGQGGGAEMEPAVCVQALGRFRVLVGGSALPASAWQSRKARELLKVLAARRGRPVPREELMDLLWPGEAVERLANRLSVALSTVRGVLSQGRALPAGYFVVSNRDSCRLDLDHVEVDIERFLADAAAGLEKAKRGDPEAPTLLARAESAYTGDFLEENAYDDWAVAVREEARAAYIATCRQLAEAATDGGEPVAAGRYLRRLLERDPYDERAYLTLLRVLVSGGQHGEAHRSYGAYSSRMREIGVEPAPFPGLGSGVGVAATNEPLVPAL